MKKYIVCLLLLVTLLASCAPKGKDEMRLGDTFQRLADGEELTSAEILDARTRLNALQMALGNFGITGEIDAKHAKFEQAEFTFMPLEASQLRRLTNQEIATATETSLQFSELKYAHGSFVWDSATPHKILIKGSRSDHVYLIVGSVVFASNATGNRTVTVASYDSGDVKLDGMTVAQVPACNGTETVVPFALHWFAASDEDHLRVRVLQSSGGNLNVTFAQVGIARIY